MPAFQTVPKSASADFIGRFREIVSDPLNLLIERVPLAGTIDGDHVYLHNGNKVSANGKHRYYDSFSDILVINRGVHEPLEEFVFQEVLKSLGTSPIMVELGSYWAHYSMWLKKLRPEADVFMVEPEADNLATGKYNFSINGYQGKFFQDMVGKNHLEIDVFLNTHNLEHIEILHSDIQGYEVEMLDGAHASLDARRIDYLFISTHQKLIHELVVKKITDAGYRVEVSSNWDETTSYDGFVFASSPEQSRLFENFRPLGRNEINNMMPQALGDFIQTIGNKC